MAFFGTLRQRSANWQFVDVAAERSEEGREQGERRRGRIQRPERVAVVEKIEDQRKPDDFFGYHNSRRTAATAVAFLQKSKSNKGSHFEPRKRCVFGTFLYHFCLFYPNFAYLAHF